MIAEARASWSRRQMTCANRATPYRVYQGAAVHWPGDPGLSLTGKPHAACQQALVGIENYQMDSKDYGAIAYQVVACLHQRVIEGRTRRKVNGANGDTQSNVAYGSILALIGMDDEPTDALLTAILTARQYLGVSVLKTHNDVRPQATACPGPDLTRWIGNGYPAPEDDVAAKDIWNYLLPNRVTGGENKAGTLLSYTHKKVADLSVEVGALRATVDLIASTTSLTAQQIEDAAEAGAAKALENLTITVETDD